MQKWFAAAVLGASVSAMAQQAPTVENAQFRTEPASAGLAAAVGRLQRASGPLWLGYEVDGSPGSRFGGCLDNARSSGPMEDECCGAFRLEGSDRGFWSSGDGEHAAPTKADVLVRIDHGAIDQVRFVSHCRLDAGGLPFTWLTGVTADESVIWLSGLVTADSARLTDQVLAAMAMHETQKATAALSGLASAPNPLPLRVKAAFWLGAERGHDGLLALERLMSDADPELRSKLAFDVSVSHEPAAVDDLIRMAKSDPAARVREQALFWVAQKAGTAATATLKDVMVNDPDLAVKKKAVFALSQLPHEEAVTELLQVAQTNTDPAIRKEAIFWLGQTRDPRALNYFESVLAR